MFIVEEDMTIPDDALEKLLEVDAPIVSGLYALRHGDPVPNLFTWYPKSGALGNGLTWDNVKEAWGKTIRVGGGCMGCLLVDRSALDFCFEGAFRGAPDIPFMQHAAQRHKTMARLDVVCGHIRTDEILYPDFNNGYRIERYQS